MAYPLARMACPGNGIYVVQGEMSTLLTAMKKINRWSSHVHQEDENDILVRSFADLKEVLNEIGDLREVEPSHFLAPFLEVIRSEETTGPVTSLALSSVNKFLSYGLIDPKCKTIAVTVENIAEAVTHARFVGTDQTNDSVVLLKILLVLRTLMLSPEGAWLTNESVIEILLSCFRMCFETRLNELLRRSAENCLRDMVQMLFSRLPNFVEDLRKTNSIQQKLKMNEGAPPMDGGRGRKRSKPPVRKTSKKIEDPVQISSTDEALCRKENSQSKPPLCTAENSPDAVINNSPSTEMCISKSESEKIDGNKEASSQETNVDSLQEAAETEDDQSPIVVQNHSPPTHDQPITGGGGGGVPVPPPLPPMVQHIDNGVIISIEDSSFQASDLTIDQQILPEPCQPPTYEKASTSPAETVADEPKQQTTEEGTTETRPLEVSTPVVVEDEEKTISPVVSGKVHQVVDGVHGEEEDWTNQQGVRFTSTSPQQEVSSSVSGGPYGLLCAHELLRFLASLCNPLDRQNSDSMLQVGLGLISVALEVGADSIGRFSSLTSTLKNDVCRSLLSLLNTEKLPIFASVLQVSFLLFESLRSHLKFQLEKYLTRLTQIIVSDSPKISYEHREIALESVVQLWRIPGLVTELYLNYDCSLYCPNLYEDLTNLLAKNAFPVQGVYNTHLLSLDALLTVIDSIESHCNSRILNERQHPLKGGDMRIDIYDPSANYIHRTGNRQKISANIPSHEHLMAIKRKKKLLSTGTEHFNSKPKKGIQFLQEQNLLSSPLDPAEVVTFLRENPHLDKKMIGEFISNRANIGILDRFVKSFDFADLRIDEALRLYLETFRLPGESPLISLVMEHFAEHWHKCNNEPFANADVAFTLAYAVIMLNVDQHNTNVKRQNNPMTIEDFKRNLTKVNGGQDFDEEMLNDIYTAIKNEEIVMPAEQTGLIRENYEWKTLLRRGSSGEGVYIHAPNGLFDHDLFSLIWSPALAALSHLFDKTSDPTIYQKAVSGFRKCAMISAHYGMSSNFDSLIVSLCKYTMLHFSTESPDNLTITFGGNPKAKLATKTVFSLVHRHGDIIRDSWRNILDCIVQLYRCKLLPKILVEAEDFIELSGKISLVREEIQLSPKTETGILSSLYSYIALGAETSSQRTPSPDDQEAIKSAQNCIRECNLEQLITESKFLRLDSLQYYIKALITASYGPEGHVSLGSSYSEDTAVFFLELLLKVVIQNRDRIISLWATVKEHIYTLMTGASACDHHFLLERSVVGLLRLAIRLMHREEICPVVLQSLRMLLLLKSSTLTRVSRQISYGTYELLKTSAFNIHSPTDWAIIFTLLECVGAGAPPPRVVSKPLLSSGDSGVRSDTELGGDSGLGNERGCTSDSELSRGGGTGGHSAGGLSSLPASPGPSLSPDLPPSSLNTPAGWILVGGEGEIQGVSGVRRSLPELALADPLSLAKCVDSLAFLVRDHITPYNYHDYIRCIRTFVEAAAHTVERKSRKTLSSSSSTERTSTTKPRKKGSSSSGGAPGGRRREERASSPQSSAAYDADESDPEEAPGHQQVCSQLLELMYTLHMRTGHIFKWWAEETGERETLAGSYWPTGWLPLLQSISRLASHPNRTIRMSAITYLQRALLLSDLDSLTGLEWEECFREVLFPLLSVLLSSTGIHAIEESRIRAATVLSKVFLHHLSPLQVLPSFPQLWLTILDYMDKYMHADNSDLLLEAVPESLKNLLLVMDSAGVFTSPNGVRNEIWTLTWERIQTFLPSLRGEIFKETTPTQEPQQSTPLSSQHPSSLPPGTATTTQDNAVLASSVTDKIEDGKEAEARDLSTSPTSSRCVESGSTGVEAPSVAPPAACPPTNWQPTAPIYPHLGQMISTPIGPPSSNVPVYSGFSSLPQPHAEASSAAQFFFQDHSQDPTNVSTTTDPRTGSSGGSLLSSIEPSRLPLISPPSTS